VRKKRGPSTTPLECSLVLSEEIVPEVQDTYYVEEGSHSSGILYRCMSKYCNSSAEMDDEE
jgi:hypothetical protein